VKDEVIAAEEERHAVQEAVLNIEHAQQVLTDSQMYM
jgi:hypothetical protein